MSSWIYMQKVEDLIIWRKTPVLTKEVYELIAELSHDEKYGLSAQIKGCSISIPSNIAEGAGRNSTKEFKHFLSIANGSTYELQTQLLLLIELNMIAKIRVQPVIDLCVEIQKMNYSFQQKLKH